MIHDSLKLFSQLGKDFLFFLSVRDIESENEWVIWDDFAVVFVTSFCFSDESKFSLNKSGNLI